ncbi:MAG: hypothetical protein Q9166_000624 [cf. Caloplaca sp. 2 TL-2023]
MSAYYTIGLFVSIIMYRILLHRLRRFPGPPLAAASKLWHVWQCRNSRNHIVLESLREKYGPFVRTALTEYARRIQKKTIGLHKYIDQTNAQPTLVNELMNWLSFDVIGDIAFSQDFRMMESTEKVDIASAFIEDAGNDKFDSEYMRWLSGETVTAVIAGSDTTAPTPTTIFYLLALHPKDTERITQELSNIDPDNIEAVAALPHLNGAINEALRLFPAALTFVMRVSPPQGLLVEGTWIPGDVKIVAPRYSIGRVESAWDEPHKFYPERWYSRPELIRDRRAFAPFGLGRTSCVGKDLAMMEIRMVVATLLSSFLISFAPGDNGEAVERDMRDQVFHPRKTCY